MFVAAFKTFLETSPDMSVFFAATRVLPLGETVDFFDKKHSISL